MISYTISFAQTDSVAMQRMTPKDLKKLGDNFVLQGDNNSAIDYYELYLKRLPGDSKIQYKLADSYRAVRDYERAEKMYLKAYTSNAEKNVLALYSFTNLE